MAATSESVDAAARTGRVTLAARYLLDRGKVAPSLVADDRGYRSCWVPLPGMGDRSLLASLLVEDTLADHARVASELAEEVDYLARQRLVATEQRLIPVRSGRRTVPQAWVESLTSLDPLLSSSLPGEKVGAFAEAIAAWVASGAVALGRGRLCVRIHEPGTLGAVAALDGQADRPSASSEGRWWLELLVQDGEELSLLVPIGELWAGRAPFPAGSLETILASLARMAAVAPELRALLDESAPTGLDLDTDEVMSFVEERLNPLAEIGVSVLLPAWWTRRRRVSLRARASSAGPQGVVTEGGFDFDRIVSFTWEAALGDQKLTKADLRRLQSAADAKRRLVQIRGEWVQVDPDDLRSVMARAGAKGSASTGDLVKASVGLGGLDDADHDRASGSDGAGSALSGGPTEIVASGWLGRLLDQVHSAAVAPEPTPDGFGGELRPYQERGVGWLAFLGRLGLGACLADDMGLGKTAQLIATLLVDRADGPTLVVCPVSVLGNWARELERFAPDLGVEVHHGPDRFGGEDSSFTERAQAADVVLTTYSLVGRDIEHLTGVGWGRIVLDEAQQIKNSATATARAVNRLRASRRVAMTGTPVENRLAELWSIMHFLNPGLLGPLSSFSRRFAAPIERDQDEVATQRLQGLVSPFLLRRLKTDRSIISDLPDKIEQTEHCPLTQEQATLYQAVVDDLLAAAASEEGIARSGAVLGGITKLKQVCNHPAHFLGDGSALSGRSGKLDRVEELLDAILDAGEKVLCFTQFAQWGDLLVPHLSRRYGQEVLWLHGGVTRARREETMARFKDPDGPQIFLLSIKAGGTGLNLTAASHVVHLDRWWNPAVEDQATDRAHRIGQRRTVLVHKLVSAGTIEERIDEMITSKRALAQRVVGSGEQWITQLDTDALRDAVALRPTEVS